MASTKEDLKRMERHAAAMDTTGLYNTEPQVWEKALRYYRKQPDGGPTFRVLEGNVWGVPRLGWARWSLGSSD